MQAVFLQFKKLDLFCFLNISNADHDITGKFVAVDLFSSISFYTRHKVRAVLYRCLQSAKVLGLNPGYISSLVDIVVESLVSTLVSAEVVICCTNFQSTIPL